VTNLAESGVFNNSDFSINDMANQTYSEKYIPRKLPDENGQFVLYLTPTNEKPDWNHVVVYIDQQHYYPVRFDYYNQQNEVEKQALYQYTKIGNYWVAEQVSMEDRKKEHKTTLLMSDIKVNTGLDDNIFTLDNLVPPDAGN
jgi:outer membrane lipoprotein-sorting protein